MLGLKMPRVNYLLFVDPDDSIEENCLKGLLEYANNNNYEVVYSPFTFVEINGDKNEYKL